LEHHIPDLDICGYGSRCPEKEEHE